MTLTAVVPYKCSLVIPTKNGGPLFQEVIQSLKQQSLWSSVEFIVIDSGSTDQTVQIARDAGAKVVEIAPALFNHGATRDQGIGMASCELVILMVQDAVLESTHVLESLMRPFDDPEVAGVYARQRPRVDADLLTKRNLNNWLTGRELREVRQMQSLQWYEQLPPIEKYFFCNFDNVCSAIRKSVWRVQKFGSVNFGEDIDWAERVLKAGHSIVYEPLATVVHSHDRPLIYEYKRTYVCHRKLFTQFGLHLVPSLKQAFSSWLYASIKDIDFVFRSEASFSSRLKLAFKVPQLNLLSMLGQYRAVRDELAGVEKKVTGV